MKESYFYKKLKNKVQCNTCSHFCQIKKGEKGICGVRKNKEGKLLVLNYDQIAALNIDPIEKKPLYHFLPDTKTLSLAAPGCNFKCESCQNWQIAQEPKINKKISGKKITPKEIIQIAEKNKIPSISYTYTEPTIFSEYALDTMKLASKKNIKNVWVTNGFFSPVVFNKISPFLDAVNVDLKSFSEDFYKERCGAKLKPILENIKRLSEENIWTEITTLFIPGYNDSRKEIKKIVNFIKKEVGLNTPWHISKFSGSISWKLQDVPDTPIETLKKAFNIAEKEGLNYVYIGNISSLGQEDTYCPNCNTKIIERDRYHIIKKYKDKKCQNCNQSIPLIVK